jgi:multiple sugar transport system ATP-binding protein
MPCLDRKPGALSGGERQRVALGRALVRKPKVFLFDEPLSNLDAQMRVQMRAEISRLRRRAAATMIYVTHDQQEAMAIADRIAVIKAGEIQQWSDPLTLYQRPANLFVAGFIGSPSMNFFHGRLERSSGGWIFLEEAEGRRAANGFTLAVPEEEIPGTQQSSRRVVLGLRPEHIMLVVAKDRLSTAGEHAVTATLQWIEITGAEAFWHLKSAAHQFVARANAEEAATVGQQVLAVFNLRKVRWFDPATGLALT